MTLYIHVPKQGFFSTQTWEASRMEGHTPNGGLLFQRYCGLPLVRKDPDGSSRGSPGEQAAQTFQKSFEHARAQGVPLLKEHHERLKRLGAAHLEGKIPTQWDHVERKLRLESPLALGLGSAHPLENGMTFHHTLGVPYLPGTALKGLARAWARLCGKESTELFGCGPNENGRDSQEGALIFLDALPLDWPKLEVDIINCHLPAYYGQKGNWGAMPVENPVPVHFLTVAPKTYFCFRIGHTRRGPQGEPLSSDEALERARQAMTDLRDALATLGIGGKTSSGYGFLEDQAGASTSPRGAGSRAT